MAKTVFDLKNSFKKYFFKYLYSFRFKTSQRTYFVSGENLKNVKLNFFSSSFQGNTPNFLRPCTQGKRQHKDMNFWNWGPTTIWHNMTCGRNCFQKSLHPNIQYI